MTDDSPASVATRIPVMLPWHEGGRQRIATALHGGRLPHAILLHGPRGVGKEVFAGALAAALFCRERGDALEACGRCTECALSRAGSHPDLYWLRPLEDKRTISVDQVREVSDQLGLTSMRRGYRVSIVAPANTMTVSAQNALLKTLEEPAPRTLIVLVTARPSSLLPTLRSRCQRVEIARPPEQQSLEWLAGELGHPAPGGLLEISGGAPLRALEIAPHFEALEGQMTHLLEDLLAGRIEATRCAEQMMGEGLPVRLDWLESWLRGALARRTLGAATRLTVPGGPLLQRLASEVNISVAFRLVDRLREARRLLEGSAAAQLVMEAFLVDFTAARWRGGVV